MGTRQVQIWNVPFPRNPLFTGREDTLKELRETLASARAAALSQPHAISGLGGIGKTQTAIEYAYRYADHYQEVFWVGADTPDVFATNLAALAGAACLNLPDKEEQDQGQIINGVTQWLQTHTTWLLILDNCELDRSDTAIFIRSLLAQRGKGDLLLTTRARATGSYIQRVPLDRLSEEEGTLFLLRRTKRLKPMASLTQARATDRESARAIVRVVGGLPLALDQAGAYVEEKQCDLMHYLRLYHNQKERADLLQQRGGTALDHLDSVMRTFTLSFEQIEQTAPMAGDILRVCALLYAEDIPEAIFVEGASHLGPILQALADQAHAFDTAIAILSRYSLIQRDSEQQTLSMHQVVQAVLQAMMQEPEQRQWAERVICAVNTTFPEIDHTTWAQCERYLPHALACRDAIERWDLETYEAACLLNKTGYYLDDRFQYEEALPFYQRALAIQEQVSGPEHPDTATSLNNLAYLYESQGMHEEALPFYQRALAIREQVSGPNHPDTATSLNNLAYLYERQGKYEEALPLLQRALAIQEQVLGSQHPDTAQSLNNLAALYNSQGKYEEALPLYQRALAIREQVLGSQHPDTAQSLNNLAYFYESQGKYEEALPLLQRALAIQEQVLGSQHPYTAVSLSNLAYFYTNQGKYEEALLLLQRALIIREQVLGPEHPDMATSLFNLAYLYERQGMYEEALPLQQRALAIYEQVSGPNHPDTATSLNNLAYLYESQGKYEEALPFYQRALAIREQVSGPDHPDTAVSLNNLAYLYNSQGKYEEALPLLQRALAIMKKTLVPNHPDFMTVHANLTSILEEMERKKD